MPRLKRKAKFSLEEQSVEAISGPRLLDSRVSIMAAKQKNSMPVLALVFFAVLMIFPFVAQYLPLGFREFLSASLK